MDNSTMTPPIVRNGQLFNDIADQIEEHEESYDQTSYVSMCGGAFCIAGHALVLAGLVQVKMLLSGGGAYLDPAPPHGRRLPTGRSSYIEYLAQESLGLTKSEAIHLFAGKWTPQGKYESVPEALRAYAKGDPILPEPEPKTFPRGINPDHVFAA